MCTHLDTSALRHLCVLYGLCAVLRQIWHLALAMELGDAGANMGLGATLYLLLASVTCHRMALLPPGAEQPCAAAQQGRQGAESGCAKSQQCVLPGHRKINKWVFLCWGSTSFERHFLNPYANVRATTVPPPSRCFSCPMGLPFARLSPQRAEEGAHSPQAPAAFCSWLPVAGIGSSPTSSGCAHIQGHMVLATLFAGQGPQLRRQLQVGTSSTD